MNVSKGLFNRTSLLLGDKIMETLATTRVIIFGLGGVGSWCAESLVRSGVGHLTMVDSDRVCITNINRQAMATCKTIGQVKVEAMRQRLLDINPDADIRALQMIYNAETSASFNMDSYDYIIDAIDSLKDKIHLIRTATRTQAVFFSSMGAALKIDPLRIRVAEFWKVNGCPFAALIRKRIRQGELPAKKFLCVYSDEVLENQGISNACGTERCLCPKAIAGQGKPELENHEWCSAKAVINGTLAHTTATFGFTLAGLVMQDIVHKKDEIA